MSCFQFKALEQEAAAWGRAKIGSQRAQRQARAKGELAGAARIWHKHIVAMIDGLRSQTNLADYKLGSGADLSSVGALKEVGGVN